MAMFSNACYCIITGASKGLGREMAVQFAREWNKTSSQSDLVLISRNRSGLEETRGLATIDKTDIIVHPLEADLSNLEGLPSISDKAMEWFDPNKHKHVLLVHNAGSLGDITRPIHEQGDATLLTAMMTLHVTSMWTLTAKVISTASSSTPITIINISSLLASIPVAGLGSYSLTRAARNMFIKTLSLEHKDECFRALTYTPGMCDTEMADSIKSNVCFAETKTMLDGMPLLQCAESIGKMIKILKDDKFENGAVIDFYDYK